MNQAKEMGEVEKAANKESEVASRQAERIRGDFGGSDKRALEEANKQPGMADYTKDLQAKLEGSQKLLQELRQSIMNGEHQTGDVNKKVQLEKLLDKGRYKVHHAFAKPEDPGRVASAQASLENAGKNFQQRFIKQAETMDSALKGEQSQNERYPGEMAKNYNVDNIRENLPADKMSDLQTEVSSALDRLKDLQPEIEKIAQEKALKPEEKDEVLKNYATMYEQYNKVKDELKQVMEDVEKARK